MKKNLHGGGANTNVNGLHFEQTTDLVSALRISGYTVNSKNEIFFNDKLIGISAPKYQLYQQILKPAGIDYQKVISKQLLPDEALYLLNKKTIYIIEKKFQSTSGSVDEKLQTCGFKLEQYKKLFNPLGVKVSYFYVLNDFFKDTKYRDVLEYIERQNCKYFFNEIPLDELNLPHND